MTYRYKSSCEMIKDPEGEYVKVALLREVEAAFTKGQEKHALEVARLKAENARLRAVIAEAHVLALEVDGTSLAPLWAEVNRCGS